MPGTRRKVLVVGKFSRNFPISSRVRRFPMAGIGNGLTPGWHGFSLKHTPTFAINFPVVGHRKLVAPVGGVKRPSPIKGCYRFPMSALGNCSHPRVSTSHSVNTLGFDHLLSRTWEVGRTLGCVWVKRPPHPSRDATVVLCPP